MTVTGEQCTAVTAAGKRCRKLATWGLAVCPTHAGARVGQKGKLDDQVTKVILQVLRAGGYDETAATRAGVTKKSFYEWLRKGDPAGTDPNLARYRAFRAEVEKARAESESRSVALVAQAATTNWQAAAWLLERRWPERWARPSQREKDEGAGAPVTVDPFAEVDELAQRRIHR